MVNGLTTNRKLSFSPLPPLIKTSISHAMPSLFVLNRWKVTKANTLIPLIEDDKHTFDIFYHLGRSIHQDCHVNPQFLRRQMVLTYVYSQGQLILSLKFFSMHYETVEVLHYLDFVLTTLSYGP